MNKHKSLDISLRENGFEFFGDFKKNDLLDKTSKILADLVSFNISDYAILPLDILVEGIEELRDSHKDDFCSYVKLTEKGNKKFSEIGKPAYMFLHTKDGRLRKLGNFPVEEDESRLESPEWHTELLQKGYNKIMSCGKDSLVDSTFEILKDCGKEGLDYLSLSVDVMGSKDRFKDFGFCTNIFYARW